jgi:hypothetical protein
MLKDIYKYQYNTKDLFLTPSKNFTMLKESNIQAELVPGIEINKKIKYNQDIMIKAINYGMIILITYRGDKDEWKGGRERVLAPYVLGKNKNTTNILVRGWHLDGYSVSQKSNVKKVWRLFKTSNILSMTITGDFIRLPSSGYRMNDRVMTEVTYAKADFNIIRRNQNKLVQSGKLEDIKDSEISTKETTHIQTIQIKNLNEVLNLTNIWSSQYFNKNDKNIKVTFLKSVIGNDFIAILGALGAPGKTVKVYEDRKLLGTYMSLKTVPEMDNKNNLFVQFSNLKNINGKKEFKLYSFVKKM